VKHNNAQFVCDVVAFHEADNRWQVLLVKRGHEPFQGQWALPGGYVEPDETSQKAALRELAEETGISLTWASPQFVGLYDNPRRDPRGRVVSAAYVLRFGGTVPQVVAGDDADAAQWVSLDKATGLAFDHDKILSDALRVVDSPPPTVAGGA
jgi:8-oxo-dGTP diphosphatase